MSPEKCKAFREIEEPYNRMKNSVERISLVLGLKKPGAPLAPDVMPVHCEPNLPNLSHNNHEHGPS